MSDRVLFGSRAESLSRSNGQDKVSRDRLSDSPLHRAYNNAIGEQLAQVLGDSIDPVAPQDIFARMRGVFPAVVWEHLVATGWKKRLGHASSTITSYWNQHPPELHPLDFEWYFTPDCADYLATAICGRGQTILCLGVPTVALAAVRRARKVVLVDRNPLLVRRFPALLRAYKLWLLDIAECSRHLDRADVVLFDAPWYLEETFRWLAVGLRAAKPGGLVAFCLFPPLVRATANAEREAILEAAASAGKVELLEDAIAYETPLFESEALHAAGVSGFGHWRRGDIVLVQMTGGVPRLPAARPSRGGSHWLTYLVNSRVVKVRQFPVRSAPRGGCVSALPGTHDFVYRSVSAGDYLRHSIDLWTSRNRVAQVGDLRATMAILQLLENGGCLNFAIGTVYGRSSTRVQEQIEQTFCQLLQ